MRNIQQKILITLIAILLILITLYFEQKNHLPKYSFAITTPTAPKLIILSSEKTAANQQTSDTNTILPPTIQTITPNTGLTAGGNSLVITGSHLSNAMDVTFDGTNAAITKNSDTSIT